MAMQALSKQVELMKQRFLPWWEAREPNERRVLAMLAVVIVVFLLHVLIWQPMMQARDRAQANYLSARETYLWLEANAVAIRQMRQQRTAATGRGWMDDINQSAADAGLALKGFTPQGEQAVRVTLERQSFSALLSWLEELKQQGILPANVDISATQEPGLVNVQATLAGAG